MKSAKTLIRILFACMTMMASPIAYAANDTGGDNGGGGDVVLRDDTVVLADPFIQRNGQNKGVKFHSSLKDELFRIKYLLERYGMDSYEFFRDQFFSNLVEYRVVPEIPNLPVCKNRVSLNPGIVSEQAACTHGPLTWLREDLFRRMSIREQAKLILHERLRSKSSIPEEYIADITDGIETALMLYNEQHNGHNVIPTDDQIQSLELLMKRLAQTGLSDMQIFDSYSVFKRGGGLIHLDKESKIDKRAYIGVGTILNRNSQVAMDAVVNDVNCSGYRRCSFPSGSKASHVILRWNYAHLTLEPGASLKAVSSVGNLRVGEGARVEFSTFESSTTTIGKSALVENVYLKTDISEHVDSKFRDRVRIRDKAELRNLWVKGAGQSSFFGQVPVLEILPGIHIEGDGFPVCKNKEHFLIKGHETPRSLADLRQLCRPDKD